MKTGAMRDEPLRAADRRSAEQVPVCSARQYMALPRILPLSMVASNRMLAGFHLGTLDPSHPYFSRAMAELLPLYSGGVLRPLIGARFPFERIREAHAHLQSRASVGKVIVTVGQEPSA